MFQFDQLGERWDRFFRELRNEDEWKMRIFSTPLSSFRLSRVPFELKYAIDHSTDGLRLVKELLSERKGIVILRTPRIPQTVRDAVVRIAKTQSNVLDPWLARLIFHETLPVIDSASLDEARRSGIDPYEDARTILACRTGLIRLSAFDCDGRGIMQADVERLERLNRAVDTLSASYLYHRLNECVRGKKIRFVSLLMRSIVLYAVLSITLPVSIFLSLVIAALADDVARLIGSLMTLHRSGFTRRQLKTEAFPYLVPLTVGVLFAMCSGTLLASGQDVYSGFMFGLAVVLFPLSAVIRRFVMVRSIYRGLEKEGKLFDDMRRSPTAYTLYELEHDRLEWGLLIGSLVAPFFCALVFYLTNPLGSHQVFVLVMCSIVDVLFAILWKYGLRFTDYLRFGTSIRRDALSG